MPPPRRLSPRRKDRRSRSHSPKVLHKKRRSRTRSPVRERKRSRSPYRKRSRSRERHHSPQRRRSRTPERLSPPRRKSLGTKRRSSSPHDYDQPIKRQADSTRRTYRSKSRSHSPLPVKKDSRRDESPEDRGYSRRRSPSPTYGGKLYSDQQSSSSKRNQRKDEIEMVKIVDMGKKLPKLDKRFQTLEQLAQGSFDFEENITIGIHRGPHGHQLDNDEDIPVNYNFNPKTFIMLFPKKDYTIPVFDRDEIKAFHHDDILDEEAYVEKRTITVKPTGKPKPSTSRGSGGGSSSRYRDMDYKITIGADRSSSYGDRRMVHDSGSSKSRSSRHDPEVKIRLDPKPDPKYERMYKEQQRQENRNLEDKIHRNPSDLRYSLMRKKSFDGDRESDRGRGRDSSLLDARARIEAKRQGGTDQGDYGSRDMSPPPTRMEKRKIGIKTELPDFKNRPDKFKYDEWTDNPEIIPKGASYFEHDSRARDDMNYWERKQMFIETGKTFSRGSPRGRGSFMRGRGRGRARGIQRNDFVRPRGGGKIRTPAMDEWKHDKFDEVDTDNQSAEKDRSIDTRFKIDRKGTKDEAKKDRKGHGDHPSAKRSDRTISIKEEEAALNKDSNVSVQ